MSEKMMLNVPLNRVEGDLEVRVELEDQTVTQAWCSGTMYRGIETILVGRGARDGLVITPRICGICGTSHLHAASRALDQIANVTPPDGARRIRNVALMMEHLQSDVRHGFLMFAVDFANPAYADTPLFDEAVRRYTPLRGESVTEVIVESKRLLEAFALLGGQWPHSPFMVPGGIVSMPSPNDLSQCQLLVSAYRAWYERRVLGCSIERWNAVASRADLDAWLDESQAHRDSDLGFFLRFGRSVGLDALGAGPNRFISYGALDLPQKTEAKGCLGQDRLVPSGVAFGTDVGEFDQTRVSEHVAHSWFKDYSGGKHPFQGETIPYASGQEGDKYSWAKAPRYEDNAVETGPLAEAIVAQRPLFLDLISNGGPSVLTRELARLVRPASLIPSLQIFLSEAKKDTVFYEAPSEILEGEGIGLTGATRGALGHWVRIEHGKIAHYQIITPTAWNASPRDGLDQPGPLEAALVGTRIRDIANPVELGHIARSFDLCLVCTVHMIQAGQMSHRVQIRG